MKGSWEKREGCRDSRVTYLQAMALSRGGQLGEAGGLSGLEGDLLTSNGPESWGAAGRSGRAVGTRG